MNKQRIAELAKEASDETSMMMIMEFKNFESALWEKFADLVIKKHEYLKEIHAMKTFQQWVDLYGLRYEPNYSKQTEADCLLPGTPLNQYMTLTYMQNLTAYDYVMLN